MLPPTTNTPAIILALAWCGANGRDSTQPVIVNSHKMPNDTAQNPVKIAIIHSQPVCLVRPSLMISSPRV